MKKFDQISCVFCGERNLVSDAKCCKCSRNLQIGETLIGQVVDGYKITLYKARGFNGLTFQAIHGITGKLVALKLISQAAYTARNKDFSAEVRLHGSLADTPSVVRILNAGNSTVTVENELVGFHYIVCEWIEGDTYLEFLKKPKTSAEDIIVAARDLLTGLEMLFQRNLWHNDLHDENVLVRRLSSAEMRLYSRAVPYMFTIVDIGSAVFRNPMDTKPLGDVANVGSHISALLAQLVANFPALTKEDQAFVMMMQDVCAEMIDETPGRAIVSPISALDKIEELYRRSRIAEEVEKRDLDDPFGYVNANDIPSNWLLKHMFSDRLPYFHQIANDAHQSVLITGPRGSGKTMILKNMRFVTIFDSAEAEPAKLIERVPYVGLFFSARANFGNYLVSFREQAWAKDEAKIMLYFNILITVELIDVLYRLESAKLLPPEGRDAVLTVISSAFNLSYVTLNSVKARLLALSKLLINDETVKAEIKNSTPAYLIELLDSLRGAIPLFNSKSIVILIDDLTLPRIPIELQRALIPALFNTGATYKTRVTAHSDGLVLQDAAKEHYKENRDFVEINLGHQYWILSDEYEVCRDGFDDVLRRRFELAKRPAYQGLERMIGTGQELDEIGREIHRLAKERKLRVLKYHGSRVVVKLCSGDISYLLDMLGKMERENGIGKYPVLKTTQNRVIRNYARTELRSLQDIKASLVPSLHDIAFYFGVWSKSKLFKKETAEHLRIELSVDRLSEIAKVTSRELLSHGIFIDGGFGNMSDGYLARRLLFRRIFTPAFPTTFNNRNTFPMRDASFVSFVKNPKGFVTSRMSEDDISPLEQQQLEQLEFEDVEGIADGGEEDE
jgi:hypothetical protein